MNKPKKIKEYEDQCTYKEKAFIANFTNKDNKKTFLNGTKSALEAYDVKKYTVAGTMATENLKKPHIKRTIEFYLQKAGYSPTESINRLISTAKEGMGVKATASDQIRADELLLKLSGAVINKNETVSHKFDYSKMSKSELLDLKKKYDRL